MPRTDDERVPPLRRLWRYGAPYRRRTGWATTHSVLNKLIDLGVHDMPAPPPLHVHPSYIPREPR